MRNIGSTKRLAVALAACALLLGSAATAQDDATARANKSAYQAAMKCFVANGIAVGDFRKSGNTRQEGEFEAKARVAFDTAEKLGSVLGYSNERVSEDFGLAQSTELPRMMTDEVYYRSAASYCKALGLM